MSIRREGFADLRLPRAIDGGGGKRAWVLG
jgi:hypothetical protein